MAAWSDFHTNPRKSYYLFLRQGYQQSAGMAHARVKRIDAMIAAIESSKRASVFGWRCSVRGFLDAFRAAEESLIRLWGCPRGSSAVLPAKPSKESF